MQRATKKYKKVQGKRRERKMSTLQSAQRRPILDEELYTVMAAAEELQVSPWTIWAKLTKGELVRTKIGSRTFIRRSELRKLIVDQPVEARA
jgi:hypothetical protein